MGPDNPSLVDGLYFIIKYLIIYHNNNYYYYYTLYQLKLIKEKKKLDERC